MNVRMEKLIRNAFRSVSLFTEEDHSQNETPIIFFYLIIRPIFYKKQNGLHLTKHVD